jgi:hypothetical protein
MRYIAFEIQEDDPLRPALSIGGAVGNKRAGCLSDSEFPRVPAASTGRCSKHYAGRQGTD